MRKLFALLFVAAAFTFVACDKKAETAESTADTLAVDSVAVDPAPIAPVEEDTTAAAADTTAPSAE